MLLLAVESTLWPWTGLVLWGVGALLILLVTAYAVNLSFMKDTDFMLKLLSDKQQAELLAQRTGVVEPFPYPEGSTPLKRRRQGKTLMADLLVEEDSPVWTGSVLMVSHTEPREETRELKEETNSKWSPFSGKTDYTSNEVALETIDCLSAFWTNELEFMNYPDVLAAGEDSVSKSIAATKALVLLRDLVNAVQPVAMDQALTAMSRLEAFEKLVADRYRERPQLRICVLGQITAALASATATIFCDADLPTALLSHSVVSPACVYPVLLHRLLPLNDEQATLFDMFEQTGQQTKAYELFQRYIRMLCPAGESLDDAHSMAYVRALSHQAVQSARVTAEEQFLAQTSANAEANYHFMGSLPAAAVRHGKAVHAKVHGSTELSLDSKPLLLMRAEDTEDGTPTGVMRAFLAKAAEHLPGVKIPELRNLVTWDKLMPVKKSVVQWLSMSAYGGDLIDVVIRRVLGPDGLPQADPALPDLRDEMVNAGFEDGISDFFMPPTEPGFCAVVGAVFPKLMTYAEFNWAFAVLRSIHDKTDRIPHLMAYKAADGLVVNRVRIGSRPFLSVIIKGSVGDVVALIAQDSKDSIELSLRSLQRRLLKTTLLIDEAGTILNYALWRSVTHVSLEALLRQVCNRQAVFVEEGNLAAGRSERFSDW